MNTQTLPRYCGSSEISGTGRNALHGRRHSYLDVTTVRPPLSAFKLLQ
jgi:hypothetical protein